jgi:hypothetical protein
MMATPGSLIRVTGGASPPVRHDALRLDVAAL